MASLIDVPPAHAPAPAPAAAPAPAPAPARARAGFDMSRFRLRHVALHVAYRGEKFFGFASQERGGGDLEDAPARGAAGAAGAVGTAGAAGAAGAQAQSRKRARERERGGSPAPEGPAAAAAAAAAAAPAAPASLPTVESELFAALERACLVEGRAGAGYQRCGRTDRGVSAAGQVVSLRLRSRARRADAGAAPLSPAGRCSDALNDIGCVEGAEGAEGAGAAGATAPTDS